MPYKQTKRPTQPPAVKQPGHPVCSVARCPACERRLKELKAFKKKYGHGKAFTLSKAPAELARWVNTQRKRRKQGKLSEELIRRLDELGIAWSHAEVWEKHFRELETFRKRHGHCEVVTLSKTYAALTDWVYTQRRRRRLGKLSEEQIQRLDELGFTWNHAAVRWDECFSKLEAFKKQHGHCIVSTSKTHSALANWVRTQRQRRKQGKLSEEQIRRLDKLGITWSNAAVWETHFSELEAFKKTYGHCKVSTLSKTHAILANWVHIQRNRRKHGKLSEEQSRRLDELGFVWDGRQEPGASD
jgi:uncharacterized protein YjiS (DUF1127 family)